MRPRPCGWSRDQGCGAMFVFEEMRRAIEAAAPARLGEVTSAIWKAYGAGGLTDEQAGQLDELLRARQGVARAAPSPAERLDPGPGLPALPGLARAKSKGKAGSRPASRESLARRRRWAAAGYMPPAIAAAFTPAEQAAIAVVAAEIGKRGSCSWAIGHVAAVAGVCATVVKRALRLARTLGLITVEERRIARRRNDTNVVRLASREWAAWLRLRLPRSALAGPGGTAAPCTNIGKDRGRGRGFENAPAIALRAPERAEQVLLFPGVA